MNDYVGVIDNMSQLFTYHVSIIGWGIAFVLIISLLTRLWKYTWKIALIINALGWLCAFYAGFTGNWFIGWFAWVIPLSGTLFMRFLIQYAMNLPYEPERKE